MHEEARHDAPVGHYDPPADLKAYAHNRMLEKETEAQKFVRQQWEAALGAVRVALGALREIYPGETYHLDTPDLVALDEAARALEQTHLSLDTLEMAMLHGPMVSVLRGEVRSVTEYHKRYEVKVLDRDEMRKRLDDQA